MDANCRDFEVELAADAEESKAFGIELSVDVPVTVL